MDVRVVPRWWTRRGEAMVPGDQKSLAVWAGIPGEDAFVRVEHEGQHIDVGTWLRARKPHPNRVTPPCDKYWTCGGCAFMHMDMPGQRDARREVVRHAFERAQLDVRVSEVVPCPDGEEGYRHVVKVGVGYSDKGRLRVGAWGKRTRRIVPIPDCLAATDPLRKVMKSFAHHVIDLDIRPFEPEKDAGVLRSAAFRRSRSTGEVLITLVAGRRPFILNDLAEALAGNPEVVGVWLHLNSEPGNAMYHPDEDGVIGVRPLIGKAWIEETLGPVTYRIGPVDFFQTNPSTAEGMYARTIEALALKKGTPFLDLYCGVGGLALQAASITGWAMGVEGVHSAIESARATARRHGLDAEFQAGRVEELLPDLARRFADMRPVVSVNPARRGLEPGVVHGITSLNPARVAYISCNPEALARDVGLFMEHGFIPGEVTLFDMFPNTQHVEAMVILESPDATPAGKRSPRRRAVRDR